MATNLTATLTVTDQNGASDTKTLQLSLQSGPVISSFVVTPQSAPANTSRHFVGVATGDTALTFTLSIPGKPDVTNSTGIFDVVV